MSKSHWFYSLFSKKSDLSTQVRSDDHDKDMTSKHMIIHSEEVTLNFNTEICEIDHKTKIPVNAVIKKIDNGLHNGNDEKEYYLVELREDNGDMVGNLSFLKIRNDSLFTVDTNGNKIRCHYGDKAKILKKITDAESGKIQPYIFINNMNNYSPYKNVGLALFECVLIESLNSVYQGRIILEAVRDTHYFHYKNGFRKPVESNRDDEFYLRLLKELLDAKGNRITNDLGSDYMYLRKNHLTTHLQKFMLPQLDLVSFPETPKENRLHSMFDAMLAKASTDSIVGSILIDLSGNDNVYFTRAYSMIMNELPLDTAEKDKKFQEILIGAILLSKTPHTDLSKSTAIDIESSILAAGEKALSNSDHQAFNELLNVEVFPQTFSRIQENNSLFDNLIYTSSNSMKGPKT